ncbi:MAG: restriction endonuclease subunit S, partial [Acetobacter sp.]|nr:restriction endonuclease subunit S [Acetobacter sp.]
RKKQYAYYREVLLSFDEKSPSVIKEMIKRLCPNGIEWKPLDQCCTISAGGDAPKGAMSKEKCNEYSIPIISNGTGENAFYGYTNIAKVNKPAVTVAARGTIGYAAYRDYPYFPIIRLLTTIPKNENELNAKYLYYCLQDKKYNIPIGGIPQLTSPMLKEIKIPLPPLEVQRKIVEILDQFHTLTTSLTEGIPAEIEARRKQYHYYRNKLLTFKDLAPIPKE